jgi:23S rRNA (uridine2552-2'-O)-methyltransferase
VPKAWLQDRKRDYYYKKAKEEHYRSRASYKLLQAAEKYHFIKNGDCVVDLGAAPGGWTQAAKKLVGTKGFVIGVDLKPIEPFPYRNVVTIVGDVTKEETLDQIEEILPRKADAVISDASQNISGIWEVDHACQIDLALHNLRIATKILRHSGKFLVKVFQGDLLNDFMEKMKASFEIVRVIKPKASRSKSSEIFLLGMRLKRGRSGGE